MTREEFGEVCREEGIENEDTIEKMWSTRPSEVEAARSTKETMRYAIRLARKYFPELWARTRKETIH